MPPIGMDAPPWRRVTEATFDAVSALAFGCVVGASLAPLLAVARTGQRISPARWRRIAGLDFGYFCVDQREGELLNVSRPMRLVWLLGMEVRALAARAVAASVVDVQGRVA